MENLPIWQVLPSLNTFVILLIWHKGRDGRHVDSGIFTHLRIYYHLANLTNMKPRIYPIVYPNSLRRHRKAAGLRQLDVARLMGLDGSTERISKWENGSADPNIDNLLRLLVLYKTTPQELYPEKWQAIENPSSACTDETALEVRIPVEA